MNDSAIRDFCIRARNELREQVARRALLYGITAEGYVDPSADVIDGRVLSPEEIAQRRELIARFLAGPEESCPERYEALVERVAYTWFNRLVAIRYMEVNDRLPSHVRMLSAVDGSFAPQAMAEALQIDIEGIDRARVAELVSAADDEALFRYLFLAQCDELATCLPDVFEPIGSAMELLLPEGLLRRGGVACQLVEDIPESDWKEGVEIVGWMYQYYNAERKREVFDGYQAGRKADREDIAPATQTFTPDWIVRFIVDNSLGRDWMLSHPDSSLSASMPFYIAPQGKTETCFDAGNPESISFCDPCCGSGHILVYAFELLSRMYEEAGYSRRDIPRMILERNITGIEIDPRAAALASFALSMKGCELDSRFLTRGVFPKVTCLTPVVLSEEELADLPELAVRSGFFDALAHLDECGSLLEPSREEIEAVQAAIEATREQGGMFAESTLEKLESILEQCFVLAKKSVIVATNPPYMGSSNMNSWLVGWVKKNYKSVYRDLCTCFITRCTEMLEAGGYAGLATTNSWMFLGSFEALRKDLLENHSLLSLVQLSVHGFKGIAAQVCAFVIGESHDEDVEGGFVRLNDFDHHSLQEEKTLEAIANPDCGWFYRRDASAFSAIPGSPIAYWASDAMRRAFEEGKSLSDVATPRQGLATSDNSRFLRKWWEPQKDGINRTCASRDEAQDSGKRWFPIIRGGAFRKWWGEYDEVVDWRNDGEEMKDAVMKKYPYLANPGFVIKNQDDYFKPAVSWSKISSADISFRFAPPGMLFEVAGACLFSDEQSLKYLQALCNSSSMYGIATILSPTLNFEVGQIATYPVLDSEEKCDEICGFVDAERELSKQDYDSFETSWDFKRHPMV